MFTFLTKSGHNVNEILGLSMGYLLPLFIFSPQSASFPTNDYPINGPSAPFAPGLCRVSKGHNGHEFATFWHIQDLFNGFPVVEDLTQPYRSQAEVMNTQKHILDTGPHGLDILDPIIAFSIVQEHGDTDGCTFNNMGIFGLPRKFYSHLAIPYNDEFPGLIVQA
jgi:hypothetical protein